MKDKALLILSGPGLADLGVSGDITLDEIRDACSALCDELGISLEFRQTDNQDEMFGWIAQDSVRFDALIINPLGYLKSGTVDFDMYHSAIKKIANRNKPVIEVRLSNIFRHDDEPTGPLQGPEGEMGFVCGLGLHSYLLGIKAAARRLQG